MNISRQILRNHRYPMLMKKARSCDVFLNHRGIDTKRSIAGLLYDNLVRLNYHPFLDSKSMMPGDKLFDKIDPAIKECKVGVAVFSPNYCKSNFCLHELALMIESNKKVIPIFCDIKPSELRVMDIGSCLSNDQLQKFSWALEEAKYMVGLTFDSRIGNWSDIVTEATNIVVKNLKQIKREREAPILR